MSHHVTSNPALPRCVHAMTSSKACVPDLGVLSDEEGEILQDWEHDRRMLSKECVSSVKTCLYRFQMLADWWRLKHFWIQFQTRRWQLLSRNMVPWWYSHSSWKNQDLQSLLRLNLAHIEPTSTGPAELLPHLFLGSRDDAVNVKVLKSLGITHVPLDSWCRLHHVWLH